ncbi:cytokinin dehydrogenase 2-like [Panicum virgatum]|uniref:cytokinin dehydrogenase n=1 Tax=Panicum virgatum TaxID=38727 RepID=A0A8T0RJQ8_PANVG|nr:cytokinin dehydrogenase 2-like [Panicum virgatum]KAG2586361.1 hypothetical protein PVAP13_5NG047700 [Panicum virgatum]
MAAELGFVLICVVLKTTTTLPPTLASPTTTSVVDQVRELEGATAGRIRTDAAATALASTDFGTNASSVDAALPAAVFYPSSAADIAALLRASSASASPFPVSARGCGHSTGGQATAPGGVVVDMASLGRRGDGPSDARLAVSVHGRYIDAGGEQLWVDVLHAALAHGLTPRSWTDYLHLTVGGTLSNAGISGQAFRHGPQISNVLELDVVTGTGEMVTCSKEKQADLFDAVLGGLGQFGIITRARIPLVPAPARARWVRLLYADAAALTGDQERLIAERGAVAGVMDYVEGSVLTDSQGLIGSWRSQPPSSFFSEGDAARVAALAKEAGGVLYCLEGAVYYGGAADTTAADVDKGLEVMLRELRYARGFAFVQDVSYVEFLDRVRAGEHKLRAAGLWDVPHPWLNLFLPRSRILDFAAGVFHGVMLRRGGGRAMMGPVLVYPMNRRGWDGGMSAVIPEDDGDEVFYTVGILRSAVAAGDLARMEAQNAVVARFCADAGIPCTQYLPSYATQAEWAARHFGPGRWDRFARRKRKYDPSAILSRGQRIFSHPLAA